MAVKKKGLGKGLDSLIPDNKGSKSSVESELYSKDDVEQNSGEQMMKINIV